MFDVGGAFVDIVKFGWGTSYVTNNLEKKIALYRHFETPVVCGGTLFEAVYARGRIDEFKRWLVEHRFAHVEISDGTIDIPREREARADRRLRARLHRPLRGRLEGLRGRLRAVPVGRVDQGGARRRRLEGDHRGRARAAPPASSGTDGEMRTGLIDEIAHEIAVDDLIFEAPTKASQAWFVKHFGPNVNLGNIPPDEVIPLETLRLGLRGDTLKEVLLGGEPAATA